MTETESPETPNIGPAKGSLVIAGGGRNIHAVLQQFVALAGGFSAPIVVIPTAAEEEYDGPYTPYNEDFMAVGALNFQVLHTRDRDTANSDAFVETIQNAQGIWFCGGRQWRLADAYLNTRTQEAFQAVLDRGGVIGGTSAGATIQGSYLIRGDTAGHHILMGDHVEGFGFLRNVCIDQHLLKRNRHFDMMDVIESHPHLLGLGIDEDTAIVVRGDEFEVIGQSYVAIYDNQKVLGTRGHFYLLSPGDKFNLQTREAIPAKNDRSAWFSEITERNWA